MAISTKIQNAFDLTGRTALITASKIKQDPLSTYHLLQRFEQVARLFIPQQKEQSRVYLKILDSVLDLSVYV